MSRGDSTWLILGGVLLVLVLMGGASSAASLVDEELERIKLRPDYVDPEDESPVVEVVEPKLTPATFDQMSTAYVMAFRTATKEAPTQNMLAMLLAHSALETGQWKEMYENNPVNMTTSRNRGYYRLPGDKEHKYRVFKDRYHGALAHVVLLARRYPRAMGRMLQGRAREVAEELKSENPSGPFYEAPVEGYATGLSQLFSQFVRRVPGPVET